MTVSILIGIIFLLAGIFILSPGLSKGLKVRTQVGRYPLVKGIIGLISLMILITVTLQESWHEELWRVVVFVVFIFALLQLISTIFTMNFWDGITDFVRKIILIIDLSIRELFFLQKQQDLQQSLHSLTNLLRQNSFHFALIFQGLTRPSFDRQPVW